MARITENQLNQLKSEISLVRLIQSQGFNLKKQGKDHIMNCPFHTDITPSLKVSESKNVFNCFGCDAKGTVIDWVIKTQGVSFRHACEILMDDAGMRLDSTIRKVSTVRKLESPLTENADNQIVLKQIIDYYHETLKHSKDALAYLKHRGLNNPELIKHFKLGFADRTLGLRLPKGDRDAGKVIRSQLKEIGIMRNSGHEHLNGSLIIPIIDEQGTITEVYGRKITKVKPPHLYLPGPHVGVFNSTCLKSIDEVILCESLIDALTFWNHGYRNVTTSYGTAGFTNDILDAFKSNNIKRVLIAYDRDKAGNDAAVELSKKLNKENIDTFRILFPKNMDANDYAVLRTENGNNKSEDGARLLGAVIRKAQWLGKGTEPEIQRTEYGKQRTDAENRKPSTEIKELAKIKKEAALNCQEQFEQAKTGHEVVEGRKPGIKNKNLSSLASQEQAPTPTASVMPKAGSAINAEISDHEVLISFGESKLRKYRIRGLAKNMSYEVLKLNILISINEKYYIDSLDLYHAKARTSYIKQASLELGIKADIIKKDIGKILIKLEELQEQQIQKVLKPNEKQAPTLTEVEYQKAMELLKSPNLLERITQDLTASGIIGEDTNKLTAYLGCVSRKLDKPLAIIIQSTSAAGKSTLMDAVIEMMPENEKVQYSAMTGQSLFYMGETSLQNKILAIAEEEGAQNASYALKLLQSEGQLTIASTGKDETSGKMETKEYHVQGPVMLFMTTTAIDIDEELMNRCLVLTVNESREQTQAIHTMQRKLHTIDGILAKQTKNKLIELHQNAQRLIKPMLVANPFAEELTFINDKTRTRRDHMKYLTLINSITLLHQHQREIKTIESNGETIQYIEVTKTDIATANKLAHEILGRSLDELPPQTRKLLNNIFSIVKKSCETEDINQSDYFFSRKTIRDATSWGNTQLKIHLDRLEDMEYILSHRGVRGQSFVYELLYQGEGEQGNSFMLGLKNMDKYTHENKLTGKTGKFAGSKRPQNAPKTGSSRVSKKLLSVNDTNSFEQINGKISKNAHLEVKKVAQTSNRTSI